MGELRGIYKCNICGNIVEVLHSGIGDLVCCEQPMELLKENSVDADTEKHVPIITKIDDGFLVKVGENEHPMINDHFIEWIEVETEKSVCKRYLKPGDKPEFSLTAAQVITARAYCSLHGLWTS